MIPFCEIPQYPSNVECHYVLREEKIGPQELFKSLNDKLDNKNLSIALVSVAWGESRFNAAAAGDYGEYAASKTNAIHVAGLGPACSFGLWQYNICGGLGALYIVFYKDSGKEIEVLTDYKKQIAFMTHYIQSKYANRLKAELDIKDWLYWYFEEIGRGASTTEFYVNSRYDTAIKYGFINLE